ncbi:MAG: TIGR00282 family metallophosphoesterase [Synergistaceae bacterium]|jgi:metallophosphoesterase (TIGR00282 family)|nr:TIGR00282 family metallophosphoesterase [Synergistaceae bacterium]
MKILFVGDVFGRPGRAALTDLLPELRAKEGFFDFVVINCENAAAGFGMTEKLMIELFDSGVDVMTSGNHIWDKKEFVPVLDRETRVLRPANYPPGAPGRGYGVFEKNGRRLGVINLQGRAFMPEVDCPFRTADAILLKLDCNTVFVDFHAEATAEKVAMARFLDGRVSSVVGTHTHVQTADEAVLPKGTAYLTDVGMTGAHGGVIGMQYASVMPKFLTGVPSKFEVDDSDVRLQGAIIELDDETGRACDIRRVDIRRAEREK